MTAVFDDYGVAYDDETTTYDAVPPATGQPDSTPDALRLWQSTGPWADADTANGYQLLRWLAGPGSILQSIDDLCRDSAAGPGWSALLDPARCPTYALPWQGQFVGVRLPATLPDAEMRRRIAQESGFARGTPAAIQAAAAPYLRPGRSLTIVERTPDPYSLTVVVRDGDLLTLSYAELAAQYPTYADVADAFDTYADFSSNAPQLEAALQAAKPAGLVMTVQFVSGSIYDDLPGPYPTYDALAAAFPTYDDLTDWTPGS